MTSPQALTLEHDDLAIRRARVMWRKQFAFLVTRCELDDLIQEARIALLRAAAKFDPHRGLRFEVYALTTIDGELKHFLRDRMFLIRPRRQGRKPDDPHTCLYGGWGIWDENGIIEDGSFDHRESGDSFETADTETDFYQALRHLPVLWQKVALLRYAADLSESQVGQRLRISQRHVNRVLHRTANQLRSRVHS